jgi:predicted amidophosphoribosyltransferase
LSAPEEQLCPICGKAQKKIPRYPDYICRDCAKRASDEQGRPLEFFNQGMSGGFYARHVGTREKSDNHICFIDGIKCWADEARFGGIVIQPFSPAP